MAVKKVDYHIVGYGESIGLTLTSTSGSTSGVSIYAYAKSEGDTDIVLGSASGAAAGTSIALTLDFGATGITAGKVYELIVIADPAGTPTLMLPNEDTSDRIRIYVKGIPTSTS
jgi:hypothetical protein